MRNALRESRGRFDPVELSEPEIVRSCNRVKVVWSCGMVYGSSTTEPQKKGHGEQQPPGCGS